ncbi:flippase activity-associated protein Agl23 [Methanoregula sp.]|uniref:flippase activity-associated protein Agl23 n=1 Tax=Methanoregula sp. TaxID=2052170 RepID=UPI0035622CFF
MTRSRTTWALVFILLLAFVLRFWQLDLKLLHHDEAVHSWFCYQFLTTGAWQYDPSYHGPFLYYVTTGMFALIGPSDFAARLLPALVGFAIIPLVYAVYRIGYIRENQMLVAALFIAISPDMVYFSRFLRHDIFMLFFTMLLLVAILYYFERGQTRFAVLAAVAAAGALCCKEEMPVIIIIFAVFFAFSVWRGRFTLPLQWKADLMLAVILVFAIMSVLYSAFFSHVDTLVGQNFSITTQGLNFKMNTTGWYQAIDHWTAMHNQQRLGGPMYFYIPLFLLYELPIFILALIGTIQFMTTGLHPVRVVKKVRNWIRRRRYTLPAGDLAAITLQQIRDRKEAGGKSEEFFRFCIVWMIGTMALYAFVGEKVPWLIIAQLLPMIFVATYRPGWQKTAFVLAGCLFLLVVTWHVAFVPVDINEPIVQVQNSEDLRVVMGLMDNTSLVVIASEHYWPLPWYYRGDVWNKKIKFYGGITDIGTITWNDPGMIILHDTESYPSLEGYQKKTYKLSYWFSFDDNKNRLPDYYLHRDGKMGSINIDVFTRLPAYAIPPNVILSDKLPVNVT